MRISKQLLAGLFALSSSVAWAVPATMTVTTGGTIVRSSWESETPGTPFQLTSVFGYDTETMDDFDNSTGDWSFVLTVNGQGYDISDGLLMYRLGVSPSSLWYVIQGAGDFQLDFRMNMSWANAQPVPDNPLLHSFDLHIAAPTTASAEYRWRYFGEDYAWSDLRPTWAHVNVSMVPEPQTYGMLLAGLFAIGAIARKKAS
jgi:hypothetical protein